MKLLALWWLSHQRVTSRALPGTGIINTWKHWRKQEKTVIPLWLEEVLCFGDGWTHDLLPQLITAILAGPYSFWCPMRGICC